jgi:site-specific DNA-methyltransferase (adenine-specific)
MAADIQFGSGFHKRNPDVLTCIANLSNDEVFTPPSFANQMLDTLEQGWAESNNGENIWARSDLKFLDPFTKSGVFLREITKRLTEGLQSEIPDLEERVDHILTKQVFGIGITELTAQLSRRSVYCSKDAKGKHSIASSFKNSSGNIWFEPTGHVWVGGKEKILTADQDGNTIEVTVDGSCKFCGARQKTHDRNASLETHAYKLIHTSEVESLVEEIFGEHMQFDVIIGNPPYQLNDGGGEGASAIPIYQKFVEQAKKMNPRMLTMVIPARWYSGGKGLDDFRESMLTDGGLAEIHDYPETDMVFPGVNIRGGVCYFLWTPTQVATCKVANYSKNSLVKTADRVLLESGLKTFVRYNEAMSILNKVRKFGEPTLDTLVQSRNPFGIPANFSNFSTTKSTLNSVVLFRSRRGSTKDKLVYISEGQVQTNAEFVAKIKVLVSKASPGGDEYPHAIFSRPFIAPKVSACTETYLIVDMPGSNQKAENLLGYLETRFFRFLVSLIKNTQNISKASFAFVPIQDLSESWTDEKLYKKYGITGEEIAFIESMIRPMESDNE